MPIRKTQPPLFACALTAARTAALAAALTAALTATLTAQDKPAPRPEPRPIPAPLAGEIPELAAQSAWEQNCRYEGPAPDKSKRGVYPVGNGRVFTYMGLGERANTMLAISGPTYAAPERHLPRGNFGELTLELAGVALPIQAVRRVTGANFVVTSDGSEDGLVLRTLTFAGPDSTTITRVVVVHNGSAKATPELQLVARLAAGPLAARNGTLVKSYAAEGHRAHAVFAMAGARTGEATLACPVAGLAPGASFATVLTIATGSGAAPEQPTAPADRADSLAAATAAARATHAAWAERIRGMPTLRTDHRRIRDLYDDWKILMLTMRDAHSGVVTPMVTRRGAWIRESTGPLLTFLRYNLWDEAKGLLEYFYGAVRLTGEVREHYPLDLDLTALAGAETDWDKVKYPDSDLLSWIVLQHFWYYRATRDARFIEERRPFLIKCLSRQKRTGGLLRFSGHETFLAPTLYTVDVDALGASPELIAVDPEHDRRPFSLASSVLYLVALQGMGDMDNGIDALHHPEKWAKDPSSVEDKPSQKWLERSLPVMQDLEKNFWVSPARFPVCDAIEADLKLYGDDWRGFFAPAVSPINRQPHGEPFANINLLPLWVGFTFPTGERSQHNLRATLGRLWHRTDAEGRRTSTLVGTTRSVGHFTGEVPGLLLIALIERDSRDRLQAHAEMLHLAEPAGEWGRLYDPGGRPVATDDPQWPHRLSPNECGINIDAAIMALNGIRHVNVPNFDNRSIKVKLRLPEGARFLEMDNLKKDGRAFNLHVDEFYAPLSAEERKQNDAQTDEKYRRDPNVDHRRFRFRMELLSPNPPMGRYQVDADVSGTMFVRYLFRGAPGGESGTIDEKEFFRSDRNQFYLDGAKTTDPGNRELPLTSGADLLVFTNREQCVEMLGSERVTYIDTGLPLGGPELSRAMLAGGKPTHGRLYLDVGFDATDRRSFKPRRFWANPNWRRALDAFRAAGGVVLGPRYVTRYQVRAGEDWRDVEAPEGRLALPRGTAAATVRFSVKADKAHKDLVLRIGSGCGYAVRVNGAEATRAAGERRLIRDQDAALIGLQAGANTIEVDLLPDGTMELTAQITDSAGLPVAGIE